MLNWPASYNDEGTLGLMARHIAYSGAHPLLYYGQDYLGSLEAYLGAGFFFLFGPSTATLRLGLLPLFALFLLCMYLLTSLLYSKSLGLFTLIVLSLGASDVLLRQLMAAGGTPELFFFTALLLLLTAWLALTSRPTVPSVEAGNKDGRSMSRRSGTHLRWQRLLAYGAWGVVAGLDLWSHLLCLPFVLCAGRLLVLFCRRELRLYTLSLLFLGLLLGISPLLLYNITVPATPKELSLFTGAFSGGYREPSYPPPAGSQSTATTIAPKSIAPQPLLQVAGTLVVGIPVATSGTALCPLQEQDAWPLSNSSSSAIWFCSAVHGLWSIGWLVLWFLSALPAASMMWHYWRSSKKQEVEERRNVILSASRLMLLMGAGLSVVAFVLYPQASSVTPWISARYLVGLLIATPALLFPLWRGKNVLKAMSNWRVYRKSLLSSALLVIVLITCFLGTFSIFTDGLASAYTIDSQQQQLITRLEQLGATRIYTSYEDCNRLAFLSNEKIVCAVLDRGLQPGLDRYYPYRAIVASEPRPLYVFPIGVDQTYLFEQKAAAQHITYKQYEAGGYMIYQLEQRINTR
jgi:hypothetical protein